MDPQKIEEFVLTYCDEHKLKYTEKNRIYTIILNAAHKKWFNTKELVVTFDPNIPKNKKIQLIEITSPILHTLTANYVTRIPFTSLTYPKTKDQLLDANEKLLDLPKKGLKHLLEEEQQIAHYFCLELTYQTSEGTKTKLISILNVNGNCHNIKEIELEKTKKNSKPLKFHETLTKTIEKLPLTIKSELDTIEEKHSQKLHELSEIREDNSDEKYKELQKKEDNLLFKMEELKDKSVRASSFDVRRNCEEKIRELKKKHQELIEKNKITREEIKAEFDKEKTQTTRREVRVDIHIQAIAAIDMPVIISTFEDKEKYMYIPIIKEFVKMEM